MENVLKVGDRVKLKKDYEKLLRKYKWNYEDSEVKLLTKGLKISCIDEDNYKCKGSTAYFGEGFSNCFPLEVLELVESHLIETVLSNGTWDGWEKLDNVQEETVVLERRKGVSSQPLIETKIVNKEKKESHGKVCKVFRESFEIRRGKEVTGIVVSN